MLDDHPGSAGVKKSEAKKAVFDLVALNLTDAEPSHPDGIGNLDSAPSRTPSRERRSVRRRPIRTRRREIVATIAATALVMFVAVMLGFTGSCSGAGYDAM